ncbi:hypothetical protein PtB15_6B633 [Puccinia triticina]|nr:hypothetical protein PtB15_6B633 [Puccinia triticina]
MKNAPLWIIEALVSDGFESFSGTCRRKISVNDSYILPTRSRNHTNARKDILIKLRKKTLPQLRQLLADLLISQDLTNLQTDPDTNIRKTNITTCRIADIMKEIRASVSTAVLDAPQAPKNEDRDCGILKRHRTKALLDKLHSLMRDDLRDLLACHANLFQHWQNLKKGGTRTYRGHIRLHNINRNTIDSIDTIIQWLKKSDFGILQMSWQLALDDYVHHLAELTVAMNTLNPLAQARDPVDGTPSETRFSNVHEDDQSAASIPTAHGNGQSNNSVATESSQDITRRAYLLKLHQSAVPLVKLGQIFLNKLLVTPASRPSFTLDDRMSSAQMDTLVDFFVRLQDVTDEVTILFEQDSINISVLRQHLAATLTHFAPAMEVLSLHLVPVPRNQLGLTESNAMFTECFSVLIDGLDVATSNFQLALDTIGQEFVE